MLALAAVTVVTGCGEQIDQTINDLAGQALDSGIRDQLAEQGVELAGDPECQTDFTREGGTVSGGGDCSAETTGGEAVEASFTGTLSTSGCEGTLTITVAGQQVVDLAEIPDCSVDFGF